MFREGCFLIPFSKKITTHPSSTPQAIPLANYDQTNWLSIIFPSWISRRRQNTMGASKSPVHEEAAAAAVMTSGIHGNHMEAQRKTQGIQVKKLWLGSTPRAPGCQDVRHKWRFISYKDFPYLKNEKIMRDGWKIYLSPKRITYSHLWKFGKSSTRMCLGKRGCVSFKGA